MKASLGRDKSKLAFKRIIYLLYRIYIDYYKSKLLGKIRIYDFHVNNYFYMIKYSKILK